MWERSKSFPDILIFIYYYYMLSWISIIFTPSSKQNNKITQNSTQFGWIQNPQHPKPLFFIVKTRAPIEKVKNREREGERKTQTKKKIFPHFFSLQTISKTKKRQKLPLRAEMKRRAKGRKKTERNRGDPVRGNLLFGFSNTHQGAVSSFFFLFIYFIKVLC